MPTQDLLLATFQACGHQRSVICTPKPNSSWISPDSLSSKLVVDLSRYYQMIISSVQWQEGDKAWSAAVTFVLKKMTSKHSKQKKATVPGRKKVGKNMEKPKSIQIHGPLNGAKPKVICTWVQLFKVVRSRWLARLRGWWNQDVNVTSPTIPSRLGISAEWIASEMLQIPLWDVHHHSRDLFELLEDIWRH